MLLEIPKTNLNQEYPDPFISSIAGQLNQRAWYSTIHF